MANQDETRSFEVSIDIDASPDKVWKAISEGEEIAKWFAPKVDVVPGVGGTMTVSWGPGAEGTSMIEAWETNRHLRVADDRKDPWCKTGDESGDVMRHLATDYFIESSDGARTTLRLVQSGFGPGAEWDNDIESTKRGWPVFLRILKHNVEHHWGEPAVNTSVNVYSRHLPTDVWQILMSEKGLLAPGSTAPGGPGTRYEFRTPTGASLNGLCYINADRQFTATAENLNNALLGLLIEVHSKGSASYCMFTLYSMSPEQVEEVRKQWETELNAILA